MAKNEFVHLWPDTVSDLSVDEFISQIVTLQKAIKDQTKEKAHLKKENNSLQSRLQNLVPNPRVVCVVCRLCRFDQTWGGKRVVISLLRHCHSHLDQ